MGQPPRGPQSPEHPAPEPAAPPGFAAAGVVNISGPSHCAPPPGRPWSDFRAVGCVLRLSRAGAAAAERCLPSRARGLRRLGSGAVSGQAGPELSLDPRPPREASGEWGVGLARRTASRPQHPPWVPWEALRFSTDRLWQVRPRQRPHLDGENGRLVDNLPLFKVISPKR